MRLAKLTLKGFKSFADATEFTFDAPVTAVVGPNGCGKSNIVDAIKWVLGERSAKSLRGKAMADVIFSGSAGRKPLGMASVTLTFDNPILPPQKRRELGLDVASSRADGLDEEADEPAGEDSIVLLRGARTRFLPVDTDTVDVERRLYRDGTSHYLINGQKARLRDIRELFMDTGVGADCYSIIEQGKVDALLLANPLERRTFFEEAAGVARFKARRVESQRKLERTENNLIRAREQLESTERRLRIVRGQASKARRYKELDSEYRALRAAVAFDLYHDLCERLSGLTSRLHDLEAKRAEAMERVGRLEHERQDAEIARHELIEQRREREHERTSAQHRSESAKQRLSMTQRSIDELSEQLAEDERRIAAFRTQAERTQQEIAEQASQRDDMRAALDEAERQLEEAATIRETLQKDLATDRHELSERRASQTSLDRERTGLSAQSEADQKRLQAMQEQRDRLEVQLRELAREEQSLTERIGELRQQLDAHRAEQTSITSEIESMTASASSLSDEQRQVEVGINDLEQRHARLDSRRATLQEMADSRVGLGEAAREALDRRDAALANNEQSLFAQVRAPLAELIDVDSQYALAVEAALGSNLQALVINDMTVLVDATELQDLPGRVTLLPLRTPVLSSEPLHLPREIALASEITPLTDLVRTSVEMSGIVERLLGRTFLVKDLDAAILLACGPLSGAKASFVTRDGMIVDPSGRITVGPMGGPGSGEGLLQRRSELAELEQSLAQVESSLSARRASLQNLDEQAAALDDSLTSLRRTLAEKQHLVIAEESKLERLEADLARIGRQQPTLREDIAQADDRLETLRHQQQQIADRMQSIDRSLETEAQRIRAIETHIAERQDELDRATERVTTSRIRSGQINEKLAGVEREHRRLEMLLDDVRRQMLQIVQSVEQRQARLEDSKLTVANAEGEITEAEAQREEAELQLKQIEAELTEAAAQSERLGSKLTAAREQCTVVERDWNSLEVSKRELEVRRESLEDRTLEDVEIDVAREYHDYRAMMSDGDVARIDVEEAQHEIEVLREAIRKLGNVNLDAIDEESQLEVRNEDLMQQVADIDRARTQLEELIERLNDASRDRFRESFEKIQANFSGQDGMFRKLFGGGRAEIRLVPNEETGEVDWLESGIEVTAKPPGKEPRSINQLSGGEKTMTAVALLMSIFQSKPSPFCLLDEVDAALDDANVERYCNILRHFLDYCHFIVITHNKRTMQIADQFYGVTMQERGVSKRVSVRFEDVGTDGQFKVNASQEPEDAGEPAEAVSSNGHTAEPKKRPSGALRRALGEMREQEQPSGVTHH